MEHTIINSKGYSIFIGDGAFDTLRAFLQQYEFKEDKAIILVDNDSRKYCLPVLMSNIQFLQKVYIIEIANGEENKTIDTCTRLWRDLADHAADRNAILINLGGGAISDLGGFVAATYKRGIRFINIPTTLLAMVDASGGGKVGINMEGLKNQVGLFSPPQAVFVIPEFLDTLPQRQMKSGFAEIIKHALIYNRSYWDDLSQKNFNDITNWKELIDWSVEIKNYYVTEDPMDTGFRKVLNFGHTVGHGVETYSLEFDDDPLLHGEAIAVGLICELYLSFKLTNFKKADLDEVINYIRANFSHYNLSEDSFDFIIDALKHDKKNTGTSFNFTLLTEIGTSLINQGCTKDLIRDSLHFYQSLKW